MRRPTGADFIEPCSHKAKVEPLPRRPELARPVPAGESAREWDGPAPRAPPVPPRQAARRLRHRRHRRHVALERLQRRRAARQLLHRRLVPTAPAPRGPVEVVPVPRRAEPRRPAVRNGGRGVPAAAGVLRPWAAVPQEPRLLPQSVTRHRRRRARARQEDPRRRARVEVEVEEDSGEDDVNGRLEEVVDEVRAVDAHVKPVAAAPAVPACRRTVGVRLVIVGRVAGHCAAIGRDARAREDPLPPVPLLSVPVARLRPDSRPPSAPAPARARDPGRTRRRRPRSGAGVSRRGGLGRRGGSSARGRPWRHRPLYRPGRPVARNGSGL